MEISKLLNNMRSGSQESIDIVNNIKAQQEEISKNLYLVQVVGIALEIEKLIASNFFSDNGVVTMALSRYVSYLNFKPNFELKNKDNKQMYNLKSTIKGANTEVTEFNKMEDLFLGIGNLNLTLLGEKFTSAEGIEFELKKGAGDIFLDLMLSKELKTTLNYSELQNDLGNNEEAKAKRPKI